MPNVASQHRNRITAQEPTATVVDRDRHRLTLRLPDVAGKERFTTINTMGAIHYGAANDQEIDTTWQAVAGAWQYEMVLADHHVHARDVLNAGDFIEYRDPYTDEWVTFQPLSLNWVNQDNSRQQIAIPQAVTAQASDDTLTWPDGYGTGRHYAMQVQTERLQKRLTIDSPSDLPAPTVGGTIHLELEFIIKNSSGVELWLDGVKWKRTPNTRVKTANRIEFRSETTGLVRWYLQAPRAWDANRQQTDGEYEVRRQGGTYYITVRIPRAWVDAAQFPIVVDPTTDNYYVGGGGDDGFAGFQFLKTGLSIKVGHDDGDLQPAAIDEGWYLFTSVTIPSGATIDSAYFAGYGYEAISGKNILTKIFAEDSSTPTAYADNPAWSGATRTDVANAVDWDYTSVAFQTYNTSPDIATVIQELVDSYDYSSGLSLMILQDDDGTPNTPAYNRSEWYSYEGDSTNPPWLQITYTSGAAAPAAQLPYRALLGVGV